MKITFTKYMHDDCERSENVDVLTEAGLTVEDAERLAAERPWYEISVTCEFDTETKRLTLVSVGVT